MTPILPSYGAYLRLDTLLGCQRPPDFAAGRADGPGRELIHHDEMLFIVVHQVFELWFKQVLHDLSRARDLLGQPELPEAERSVPEVLIPRVTGLLGRVNEVLRLAHAQFTVLETMPSVHFLAFRDALLPASGFQSVQWRELELLAGMRDADRLAFGLDYEAMLPDADQARLAVRRGEMRFADAVFDWLSRTPTDAVFPDFGPAFLKAHEQYAARQAELQRGNVHLSDTMRDAAIERMQAQRVELERYLEGYEPKLCRAHRSFLFIASYRDRPLLRWPYTLLESVIEFEERFRLLRFRHARMVERMIGSRVGTGGSSGVEYLDATAMRYRVFGALLEGRSFLLNPALLPELPRPDLLDFRA